MKKNTVVLLKVCANMYDLLS